MKRILVLVIGICSFGLVYAQQDSFFTDPSLLKPWDQGTFDVGYVHPDVYDFAKRYDSVMVDQPEILLAADSKYKGAKGDDLKQLADVGRLAMMERLEYGGWSAVEQPGPNVKKGRIVTAW